MNIDFKNKVILITGCEGFLGKEITKNLISLGAIVVGLDISKKSKINFNNFIYFKTDLSKESEINKFYKFLKTNKITPDILINNAALSYKGNYKKRKQVEINNMLSVNITSVFNMIRKFSEVSSKKANILNIASIYALMSPKPELYSKNNLDNSEIYGASKAAIIQMTKYFARYLNEKKIRVNCVSPGGITTSDNIADNFFINQYIKDVPLKRLAKLEEVVNSILFLISDKSSYINGHNLIIDGGKSC